MASYNFEAFPKIPRLENEIMTITEKIDGTNAQILIDEDRILFGSRKRWLTPEYDNFGFASWGEANKKELALLKPGRYYGEWWGKGIQRGYEQDKKIFSFFHYPEEIPECLKDQVNRVPILYEGPFNLEKIKEISIYLSFTGSVATNFKYKNPEGIMIWLELSKQYYKVPFNK